MKSLLNAISLARFRSAAANTSDSKFRFVIFCIVLIMVCALSAVDFISELGTDYGVYFSNGWFMTKGLLPYVDFWTHKAPLLVIVLAGWISVFGQSFSSSIAFLIAVAILSSYLVFVLASTLEVGRGAALLSSGIFTLFVSSHVLDPTRNGVIVLLAGIFEMLSLVVLIVGIRKQGRAYLVLSGFLVFLAFATRQTAAITYLGLLAVLFLNNGFKSIRQTIQQSLFLSGGSVLAALLFVLYFFLNSIPLYVVWDQIYGFNVIYAVGYGMKMTWWISEWVDTFQTHDLYLLQLLPEASIVTGLVLVSVLKRRQSSVEDSM